MIPDEIKEKLKLYLPGLRGVLLSLLAMLLARFATFNLERSFRNAYGAIGAEFQFFPAELLMHLSFLAFSLFATLMPFYYADNVDLFNKRDYLRENDRHSLLGRPRYLAGFAVAMLGGTWILSDSFGILFAFLGLKNTVWINLFSNLCSVISMAAIRLIQLFSLQDKWNNELDNPLFAEKTMFKRNRDPEKFMPHQLILQPLGYALVYIMTCYVAIFGFPMKGLSDFNVIGIAIGFWILLFGLWYAFLLVPIGIFLFTTVFRIVYSIPKRRLLLHHFKRMEKDGLAKVTYKGNKYLGALFTFVRPLEVTVKVRSTAEVYNCLVISGGKVNAPMYFKEHEYMVEHGWHLSAGGLLAQGGAYAQVVDIRNWGGKTNPTNLVFGFRSSHKLKFPKKPGNLTLILNPTPTTAYALFEHECKAIDTGEVIGPYTLYTATAFYNHIERRSRVKHRFDD